MKKVTLLTLIALLVSFAGIAQDQKKGYIILSAGLSSPLGNLADAPVSGSGFGNNFPGYASGGLELGLQGGYHFNKYVGVGGKIGMNIFGGNKSKVKEYWDNSLRSTSTAVDDFAFASISILVGPRFKYDVLDELEIFAMPLIGQSGFGSSNWTIKPDAQSSVKYDFAYQGGVSYGISAGIRTTGRIGVLAELSYLSLGTRSAVATTTITTPGIFGTSTSTSKTDIKQSIAWLSANVGLSISF